MSLEKKNNCTQVCTLSSIILAAGESTRMGTINKLLIDMDGIPMVRKLAQEYSKVCDSVTVVLGYESEKIKAALAGLDITFAFNPDFHEGHHSSVLVGLRSLFKTGLDKSGILIGLADQYLINFADILLLNAAFKVNDCERIMVPRVKGKRGNPVIFPRTVIKKFLSKNENISLRDYIDQNPYDVEWFDSSIRDFVADLDTASDVKQAGLYVAEHSCSETQ